MAIFGVDYSAGVPSVAALKAAEVRFVARYLSPGARRKNLTLAEADTMRAAGIHVVTVYEDTIGDALSGRSGGRSRAAFARDKLPTLGAPAGAPCYYAVDFDVVGLAGPPATRAGRELAVMLADLDPGHAARWGHPGALDALGKDGQRISEMHATVVAGQMATVLDYGRGWADVLGPERTGPYGERDVVAATLNAGVARLTWQAAAWSHGVWEPRALIQQHLGQVTIGGVVCDRDFATQPDYGQWKEDDVPLTDAEIDQIVAKVDAKVKARLDASVSLLFRGDADTPSGGTHPDNLKSIRAGVVDVGVQLAEHGDVVLSDAQLDRLAAQVAARMQLAGPAAYEITGTATPKEATP